MKKRNIFVLIVVTLLIALCLPTVAFADTGPKRSVTIFFKGEMSQDFYVTLLGKDYYFGPHQPWDESEQDYSNCDPEELAIHRKFASYVADDYYVYYSHYEHFDSDNTTFTWGYYPPDPFKILIYFADADTFVVSEECEGYAFASEFNARIDGDVIKVQRNGWNYVREIGEFFLRLLFTLAVEIGIAFAFGYKERNQLAVILFANMVTQVILNIVLAVTMFHSGALSFALTYVLGEMVVFVVEAVAYGIFLNKVGTKKPIAKHLLYAFVGNLFSFAMGIGITLLLSFIPRII